MSGLFDTCVGGAVASKYSIGHSVRLRASAAPRLYRARTTSSTNALSSRSIWFKRGLLDGNRMLAFGWFDANNYTYFSINANKLYFSTTIAGTAYSVSAPPLLRDPSAHYHVVLRVDTAQAVAANRVIIEINGVLQTLTGTFPPQGFGNTLGNNGSDQWIGINQALAAANAFDGYLSKYEYVIGATPAASAFGEQDANGIWVPKEYAGSYGTSGFYLDFSDGSSLAALTADKSGNGINWTASNISLTAGVTYDHMTDTPTNNYCTLNPLHALGVAPSFANLYTGGAITNAQAGGTVRISGKTYFEVSFTTIDSSNGYPAAGVIRGTPNLSGAMHLNADAVTVDRVKSLYKFGSNIGTLTGTAMSATDIMMVAFDPIAGKIWFGRNGTWFGSGDPAAGTNEATSGLTEGTYHPIVAATATQTASIDANFGQRPFAYTPPTGFKALCTANLNPAVPITLSGSFTGNANADGPFVWLNGNPEALTINGNAVSWATDADKTAGGFKVRSAAAGFNAAANNTFTVTTAGHKFCLPNPAQPNSTQVLPAPLAVDALIVAGGGGGGAALRTTYGCGGGGGGGQHKLMSGMAVGAGALTVTVGNGGQGAGTNSGAYGAGGSNSSFNGTTSSGGNGGQGGACNAGGGVPVGGSSGSGYAGGAGGNTGTPGGGGGASTIASGGSVPGGSSGPGATGYAYALTGLTYGSGGSGGVYAGSIGTGAPGSGAGSGGYPGGNGNANQGGGGGGGGDNTVTGFAGGNGGTGVVVISYPDTFAAAIATTGSPTITVTGGKRIYTFTQTGSITFS